MLQKRNDTRIFTSFTMPALEKAFGHAFGRNAMHLIIQQFVYGDLYQSLEELKRIRLERPLGQLSMDACEKDIPHKLGIKQGKTRVFKIEMSTNRVACNLNMPVGRCKYLEKCGESYKKCYSEHMGAIIAENMLYSKEKGDILHPLISTDMGTEANPEHLRLALICGIKTYHNMLPHQFLYTSPETNIRYDLREFRLNVCCVFLLFQLFDIIHLFYVLCANYLFSQQQKLNILSFVVTIMDYIRGFMSMVQRSEIINNQ